MFEAATQLVKKTFVFSNVGKAAAEKFKSKAQFTQLDLEKAADRITEDLIPIKNLIKLFQHHKIIAPLPVTEDRTEVTYFMPSILRSATKDELSTISSSVEVAPIMYRYKSGYLPLGVFSSLIIAIICKQNPKWTLNEDDPCRNKIKFLVKNDYDTVTIINGVYFIKVVLFRACDPTTPTSVQCTHIRSTIYDMLMEVNKNLKYTNARVQYGFECVHDLPNESSFHLCILENEKSTKIKCLEDRRITEYVPLNNAKQKIWFQMVSKL